MNENVKAFLEVVKADPELRERLCKMAVGELVAAAKEKGIELSEEDFRAPTGELGEDELGNAAGGWGLCIAVGGGGGTNSDGNTYGCVCVLYGQGGDCKDNNFNCHCPLLGGGTDTNRDPVIIC